MPGTTGPNLGLVWGWAPHEDGWGVGGFNPAMALLDAIVQLAVISQTATPPGSPSNGERYIVGASPTGAWSGQANTIAVYLTIGTAGWVFLTPKLGWRAWNAATADYIRFDGTAWLPEPVAQPMRGISFSRDPAELPGSDQSIFTHRFAFPFTIPADFADYGGASTTFGGSVVATADVVFRVQKALAASPLTFAAAGTITIGAGSIDISDLDSAGLAIAFAKKDSIRILAPTTPDAAFKGAFGTIIGRQA